MHFFACILMTQVPEGIRLVCYFPVASSRAIAFEIKGFFLPLVHKGLSFFWRGAMGPLRSLRTETSITLRDELGSACPLVLWNSGINSHNKLASASLPNFKSQKQVCFVFPSCNVFSPLANKLNYSNTHKSAPWTQNFHVVDSGEIIIKKGSISASHQENLTSSDKVSPF